MFKFWINTLISISHKQIVPFSHETNLTVKLQNPVKLQQSSVVYAAVAQQVEQFKYWLEGW